MTSRFSASSNRQKKVVIFDFDGTLADTLPLLKKIYSELAKKNKWTELTDEDFDRLRRGSVAEARKWANIKLWQFPLIIRSVKKLMQIESKKVHLFQGVEPIIRGLSQNNVDVYILSRNTQSTIQAVLERYSLQGTCKILKRPTWALGSKTVALRSLMIKKRYNKSNVWMVGDEIRDIRAANSNGLSSIAVHWGFQDISVLDDYRPTRQAKTVNELKSTLEKVLSIKIDSISQGDLNDKRTSKN